MSTITLPNIRVSSDLTVKVRLKDSGVAIDWSTLNNVKASIYSDAQRALAGRCDVSIDAEDPTLLVCQYAANKPQYVGVNRIVVSAKYHGETKTYDKPAFSFVRWTGDQAGEQITIDDPDVDVEIDVEDVSSSILDEAIRAAFAGAERANDAADSLAGVEADVEAAEALRVAAEESRVEAEEDRVEAEAARVDEEAVRVSAEDARVVAENAREAAEDLREGAEDDRAAAETARETAEAARVAAEALRVSAEGSRESAEAARASQASTDHTTAASDHTQAAADHTQAAADHTTAASDHTQASSDHTQAAADHTTAAADHTQAQADHAVMEGYDDRLDSVESEVSQLEAELNGENTWETIDLSQIEKLAVSIASSTQKWAAVGGGSQQGGGFFPVTPGQTIKITPGTISSYFAVTKDTSHTAGTTPTYATGYSARVMVSGEMEFVVPDDGNYIFVMLVVSSGTVDDVYKKGTQGDGLIERVSALEDDAEDMSGDIQSLTESVGTLENAVETQGGTIESLTTSVGNIEDEIDGTDEETEVPLDLSTYTEYKSYIIASNGKWTDNNNAGCVMIPVTPGEKYILVASNDKAGNFAILTTNAHTGGTEPDYTETFPALIRLEAGTTQDVTIPSDGHYLYAQTKSSSSGAIASGIMQKVSVHTDGIKEEVADLDERVTALEEGTPSVPDANLSQLFESMPFAVDSDGWEIPTTPGMVYALKKAAQASQIVYNALADYPTLSSSTGASAGEHTGFPYSSTKQIRKFIGYEVSFRTFMTAVQNLYGMFYTEDINYSHGQSGYGYTYDGTNCGPYYAMVCSIFALWALGYDIPWDTDQFAYLSRIGELVKVKDQTPQGVHICDLVWYQGHCVLVTGVRRDQWGNVINVQITESLGAVHSTNFTAEQFETYLHITHDAIIYRPTRVYENTYEPSEFVAVRGEATPTPFVYNYDICHYAGDYSAMRSDQPTWINYTLGNYTGMKIYKGETLLTTITPDGSSHKVDVSSYMTGAGKYSACLTDGVNDSEATHWQIVDAGCTYEDNGAKQKITFASSNGTPWWVQVCSSRGVAYCWYKPTTEDIANGYCVLDLASMIAEQYTGTPVNTTFVRVMYKADYGGVVSAMVQR